MRRSRAAAAGLIGLLALCLVGAPWALQRIDRSLADTAAERLGAAGLGGLEVESSGRSLTATGDLPGGAITDDVRQVLADIDGPRDLDLGDLVVAPLVPNEPDSPAPPEPTPVPEPDPTATPTEEPEPEPDPTPTEEPEPDPTPTEEPEPDPTPTEEPEDVAAEEEPQPGDETDAGADDELGEAVDLTITFDGGAIEMTGSVPNEALAEQLREAALVSATVDDQIIVGGDDAQIREGAEDRVAALASLFRAGVAFLGPGSMSLSGETLTVSGTAPDNISRQRLAAAIATASGSVIVVNNVTAGSEN